MVHLLLRKDERNYYCAGRGEKCHQWWCSQTSSFQMSKLWQGTINTKPRTVHQC